MTNKFWLVWSEATQTAKMKHLSRSSAEAEAKRLAEMPSNYGRTPFYALEAVSATGIFAPVETIQLEDME